MAHSHDGHGHAHHDHDHDAHGHDEHPHDHEGRGGHSHSHAANASNAGRIFWAAALTGLFLIVEVDGGLISGSLALLADAGPMLADFGGLALAYAAFRLSERPADRRRSYGMDRLQVLAAFTNGLVLIAVAGFIVAEAVRRLFAPVEILTGPMMAIAFAGLVVNIAGFLILRGAGNENLNMRGAIAHVLSDLLGSAGVILAAGIIMVTGWAVADPVISALVAVLIGRTAWRLVAESGHILLEGTPPNLPAAEVEADIRAAVPGVTEVHHVHVWSITEERPMVTLHACLTPGTDAIQTIRAIKARLVERFSITHATVEVEEGECADAAATMRH